MAIKSYKICPLCGHHNPSILIECENCEADLQMVKVTLDDDKEDKNQIKPTSNIIKNNFVKICPTCKSENKATSRECYKCHTDLLLVMATNINNPKKTIYKLVSDDNELEITITNNFEIIGRSFNKFSYLQNKGCVSRKHLMVTIINNKMFIRNYQPVNPNRPVITFVNAKMLKPNEQIEVKNGDLIGLGGENFNKYEQAAYFKVVIE